MGFGIKVSLPGYDVKTATPEQCSVHSDYANPKVNLNASPVHFDFFEYTHSSNPAVGTHNILTVNHNYSYRPIALCFIRFDELGIIYTAPLPYYVGAVASYIAYTTDTQFKVDYNKFDVLEDPTGRAFALKYLIFAEDGD